MLVPVTCICISIWPPVRAAVLVVIVMSVFFGSIVPAMARSTFWPLAVQVPATSILPPSTAFFVQVQASPYPFALPLPTSSWTACSWVGHVLAAPASHHCTPTHHFIAAGGP